MLLLPACPGDLAADSVTTSSSTVALTDAPATDTAVATTDTAAPTGSTDAPTATTTDPVTPSTGDTACVAPSDTALCQETNTECGALTHEDPCGELRTVECGACSADETCDDGRCRSVAACVDATLPGCCTSERNKLDACAKQACGVFWSAECVASKCTDELTVYSDCVLFDCPGLGECGSTCAAFCAEVLADGCGQGTTWPDCLESCEAAGDSLQVGCGIGLECQYNGACNNVPDSICQAGTWRCATQATCIADAAVCDGSEDCADGSDEAEGQCGAPDCAAGMKLCAGACATCPGSADSALFACVADVCAIATCKPGHMPCPAGCCAQTESVLDDDGTRIRMRVGKDGTIHASYLSFTGHTYYITGTPNGTKWTGKTSIHPEGLDTELALDGADRAYVMLLSDGNFARLATNKSGKWVVQTMPGIDYADLAIGADGRPYALEYATHMLIRRNDDVTDWENLGPVPTTGTCSNLAVSTAGIEVVCDENSGAALARHTFSNGNWVTSPVLDAPAMRVVKTGKIAVDAQGELEVAYSQGPPMQLQELHLARTVKGAWTSETAAPKEGMYGVKRLAVVDPAHPFILPRGGKLGVRVPGGWFFTGVGLEDADIVVLKSGNTLLCGTDQSALVCRSPG